MAFFDLSLDQLRGYTPERNEPADFDAFWSRTLEETRSHPLDTRFQPVETKLALIDTFEVTFAGFGGHPIKGWLQLPHGASGPLPGVVEFIGYGGGRGKPHDWLLWSAAGYAHLIMDTRGQGSSWLPGDTPDPDPHGGPHFPGFMTKGILDPNHHYYRRVYSDAVRAVEAARSHPAIDGDRIAITGASQGGGITLAVAGLVEDLVAVMPDVPFLSHIRRATEITDASPYQEIARYCVSHRDQVDQVFETLTYFDGMQFAARASAPALFSAGLMDEVCPPSTVFASFNHYAGPKEIETWRYNHHEGGGTFQVAKKLAFLDRVLNQPSKR